MLAEGRDPNDTGPSHSRMSDLPRGRPEAAEDFGVPVKPQGLARWQFGLAVYAGFGVVFWSLWLMAYFLGPMGPLPLNFGQFYLIVFTLGWVAVGLVMAALARRKRHLEVVALRRRNRG